MPTHLISPAQPLTLAALVTLLADGRPVSLGEDAKARITTCHGYLHQRLAHDDTPIYGINTGFGSLHNVSIAPEARAQLQINLLMSHACGTGAEVPGTLVRLMLLLKAQSLSYGHSGVQVATAQRLLDMYNREMLPVVYEQGSLGASGDLAPLAHLCLPLLGLGFVRNADVAERAETGVDAVNRGVVLGQTLVQVVVAGGNLLAGIVAEGHRAAIGQQGGQRGQGEVLRGRNQVGRH